MSLPATVSLIVGVCCIAFSSVTFSQSCQTDFDCTSSAAPVCSSGVCAAGSSQCTGDDIGEDGDDGPAGARALDAAEGVAAGMTAAICGVPASEADFYKTTIEGGSPRTVTLSWSATDTLELAAFDSAGAPLLSTQGPSPQIATLSDLPDGTYYLRVMNLTVPAVAAATAYEIEVSEPGDLFSHNGFEQCWSKAVGLADFDDVVTNSVDGVAGCIPSVPDVSPAICTSFTGVQPMCPGGIPGCPITLRPRGPSGEVHGPLSPGVNTFLTTATVDPFSMVIDFGGPIGECTANVVNTDPTTLETISLGYEIAFDMTADGNNGVYVASVHGIPPVTVNNLTKADVTWSGNFVCTAAVLPLSPIFEGLSLAAPTAVFAAHSSATVGNAVCPLQ